MKRFLLSLVLSLFVGSSFMGLGVMAQAEDLTLVNALSFSRGDLEIIDHTFSDHEKIDIEIYLNEPGVFVVESPYSWFYELVDASGEKYFSENPSQTAVEGYGIDYPLFRNILPSGTYFLSVYDYAETLDHLELNLKLEDLRIVTFQKDDKHYYEAEFSSSVSAPVWGEYFEIDLLSDHETIYNGTLFLQTADMDQVKVSLFRSNMSEVKSLTFPRYSEFFDQEVYPQYSMTIQLLDRITNAPDILKSLPSLMKEYLITDTYYLKVQRFENSSQTDLSLAFLSSSSLVEDLHDEVNPTFISAGDRVLGDFHDNEDKDWFRFSLSKTTDVSFSLQNSGLMEMYLFDSNGNSVAEVIAGQDGMMGVVDSFTSGILGPNSIERTLEPGDYTLRINPAFMMLENTVSKIKEITDAYENGYALGQTSMRFYQAANKAAVIGTVLEKRLLSIPASYLSESVKNVVQQSLNYSRTSYRLTFSSSDIKSIDWGFPTDILEYSEFATDSDLSFSRMYAQGIVTSEDLDSNGRILPASTMTRALASKWLSRAIRSFPDRAEVLADCILPNGYYLDIDTSSIECSHILYLFDQGIVKGNDRFFVHDSLTYGQMFALISRSFPDQLSVVNCDPNYSVSVRSHWACQDLSIIEASDIIFIPGSIDLDSLVSRDEFVRILLATMDRVSITLAQGGPIATLTGTNDLSVPERNIEAVDLWREDVEEVQTDDPATPPQEETVSSSYSETYPLPSLCINDEDICDVAGAQAISGDSTSVNSSRDLFVFTVNRLGSHILYSEGNVSIEKAWLFDPLHQDTRILDYDADQSAVGQNFRVGGTLDAGTKYYVYVEYASNTSGNYRIKVIEPEGTSDYGINDDHTNRLPGDTSQIAYPWYDSRMPTPLMIGQTMNGNIEKAQDIDVFSVRLPAEPRFTSYFIEVESDVPVVVSQGCYDLTSAFAAPEADAVMSFRNEFIKERQDTTGMANFFGDICLSVRGDWANTGSYTVKYSRVFPELGSDDYGDTDVQASELNMPAGWLSGNIDAADDVDMFTFVAPESDWGQVLARPMHAGHLNVVVRDSAGAEVLRHDRAVRTTPDAELSFEMTAGEEYYVELSALAETDYAFFFADGLGSDVSARLTHIEDLAGNIQNMTANDLGYEHVADSGVGWFRFTLDTAGAYDFSLANADVSWNFYRPDGSYIDVGKGNAVVELPAGENFLWIDQWFSNAELRLERSNQLPVLVMTMAPLQDIYVGTPMTFDASASTDSDGVIRDVEWRLDGILLEESGLTLNKIFDQEGAVSLELLLRDDRGGEVTETLDVVVESRPDGDGSTALATVTTFDSRWINGYGNFYSGWIPATELEYPGDVDYFLFIPPADGSYEIKTWSNDASDVFGEMLDADEQLLQADDNGGYNGKDFALVVPLEAGQRYYVRVTHADPNATGTYGMNFQRLMDDHGGSPYQATPLQVGSSVSAGLCSYSYGSCIYAGDVDYFRITPEVTGEYIIGTSGYVPFKAELIDNVSQYYQAYSNGAGAGNNVFYKKTLQAGQTYYLGLQGLYSSTRGNYEVYVLQQKDDHPDVSGAATVLNLNTPVNAQMETVDDVDWFSFAPGSVFPGTYQFVLTGDVQAELTQLGTSLNLVSGQPLEVTPTNGAFQLKIFTESVGAYSIELQMEAGDDHGNTSSTATNFARYQYISGNFESTGDWDVFEYVHSGACQAVTVESYGSTDTFMTFMAAPYKITWDTWWYPAEPWAVNLYDYDSGTAGNIRKTLQVCNGYHVYFRMSHQTNGTGAYQLRVY